jgi:MFS transporter, Spinster family, sphingosine-1-phosphate transporter
MTPANSNGDHNGSPRHWVLVFALLLISIYAFIDRVVLALLVDPIRQDLGASDLQMALLMGLVFALFASSFMIPSGHLVDRYNRRAIIGVASVLWALMTIVCGTADSIEQLFIGRAGVGIAESVIAPASFSLIRDAVPARSRGLAFSLYAMAPLIGGATSLLIGGHVLGLATAGTFSDWPLLGQLMPWQCTLIVVGSLGVPLSLFLLLAPEPARPPVEAGESLHRDGFLKGVGAALQHMRGHLGIYVPLILFVTFGAMANFSKSAWSPAMIGRTWHMAPQDVGPMLGAIVLPCGVGGLLFSGFVLNWLTVRGGNIRTYGLIAAIGSAIGMVGMGLAPSLTIALVMTGIASFFLGTSYAVGASTLGEVTPVRLMGRVTAVYFIFQSLFGQALGPFLVAFGSQNMFTGSTALANSYALWMGVYGVAMVVVVAILRHRLRRPVNADVVPAAAPA